mmetsp:Transcript_31402/g.56321  ORF Transcript_31402/g.56321 Transcript_31402/m.56321 type:complete len:205 (+) Transcript_31402:105-719(+)
MQFSRSFAARETSLCLEGRVRSPLSQTPFGFVELPNLQSRCTAFPHCRDDDGGILMAESTSDAFSNSIPSLLCEKQFSRTLEMIETLGPVLRFLHRQLQLVCSGSQQSLEDELLGDDSVCLSQLLDRQVCFLARLHCCPHLWNGAILHALFECSQGPVLHLLQKCLLEWLDLIIFQAALLGQGYRLPQLRNLSRSLRLLQLVPS